MRATTAASQEVACDTTAEEPHLIAITGTRRGRRRRARVAAARSRGSRGLRPHGAREREEVEERDGCGRTERVRATRRWSAKVAAARGAGSEVVEERAGSGREARVRAARWKDARAAATRSAGRRVWSKNARVAAARSARAGSGGGTRGQRPNGARGEGRGRRTRGLRPTGARRSEVVEERAGSGREERIGARWRRAARVAAGRRA
jgi:hypothetical protein